VGSFAVQKFVVDEAFAEFLNSQCVVGVYPKMSGVLGEKTADKAALALATPIVGLFREGCRGAMNFDC
jgi:hypothetical protein